METSTDSLLVGRIVFHSSTCLAEQETSQTVDDNSSAWAVLAGCLLLAVGVHVFMIAPSSIAPLLVERFSISKAAVGNAVSAAILGSILVQIPGGYLLDNFDNRWILVPCIGVYIAVILAIQFVESYTVFLALRVIGGLAVGLVFTTGTNIIGQVFPSDQQGFTTGLYMASSPLAFALAHVTSPLIGTAFGPLRAFLFHAALAASGFVLFWIVATNPIRSAGTPTADEFVRAIGNRSVLLLSVSVFVAFALYIFLNTWVPTYGTDVLSLPISTAGFVTALVPLVGIVARPGAVG